MVSTGTYPRGWRRTQGCAPDEKTRRVWVSGMGIRKRDLGYEYRVFEHTHRKTFTGMSIGNLPVFKPKFSGIGYEYEPNWGQKA
eukprot:scaffold3254_cov140-Skeletonema_menzelii.AAC.5